MSKRKKGTGLKKEDIGRLVKIFVMAFIVFLILAALILYLSFNYNKIIGLKTPLNIIAGAVAVVVLFMALYVFYRLMEKGKKRLFGK